MNNFNAIGRLGQDASVRYFESGKAIAEFNLAIDSGKNPDGSGRPPTWIPVKYWLKDGSQIQQYLLKGTQVGISGRLEQERWQDRNSGQQRSKLVCVATRIDLLGSKSDTPATGTHPGEYAATGPMATGWDGEF